jgi:aryl-alcohol dehydrogenase-like predicted oxidoreductase
VNKTTKLGDRTVNRMGFGAMQLPGPHVWGPPRDPAAARAVLRRVIELGVQVIDTSWFYGPYVSNELIAEVLRPYPKDLVLVTKLGGRRTDDKGWAAALTPEELRKGCETDLRLLHLDRVEVAHLRWIDQPAVSFGESLDAMLSMQKEGKIGHIGLSNVSLGQVKEALDKTNVACVSNLYSVAHGEKKLSGMPFGYVSEQEALMDFCAERGIALLPWFSVNIPGPPRPKNAALVHVAQKRGATEAQIAIAWLLARAETVIAIPGTSSVAHLEENCAAKDIELTAEEIKAIGAARDAD